MGSHIFRKVRMPFIGSSCVSATTVVCRHHRARRL
jgi:hypothetical protein